MNWQITATTIYCDDINEEVTLMVYHDWSLKCTGAKKYGESTEETARFLKKGNKLHKQQLVCQDKKCAHLLRYRDKLMAEESELSI